MPFEQGALAAIARAFGFYMLRRNARQTTGASDPLLRLTEEVPLATIGINLFALHNHC
jgi:hypothetical protein